MTIVIIGASYAGLSAALELRKKQPDIRIQVIEQQTQIGYLANGLSLFFAGQVNDLAKATWIQKDTLAQQGIELYLGEQVKKIDVEQQVIQTNHRSFPYDALILASGARVRPADKEETGVYSIGHYQQDQALLAAIQAAQVITVVGAGQTGLELADALVKAGKRVQLVEHYRYPLFKYFDQPFLAPLMTLLKQQPSLEVFWNQHVRMTATSGTETPAHEAFARELVVYSGSLQPNHDYLGRLLDVHSDQTVRVNDRFETSIPGVYAIGNLIQQKFPLTGDSYYMPSKANARRTGQALALILSGEEARYPGSLRTIFLHVFGVSLAATGLLYSEAFLYEGQLLLQQAEYGLPQYPEQKVRLQYVLDRDSKRLLGVQMMGNVPTLAGAIRHFEAAIFAEKTLSDVTTANFQASWINEIISQDPQLKGTQKGRRSDEV